MPEHRHLCRLVNVFSQHPVYFLTVCTADRARILATTETAAVLQSEWRAARLRHGWQVGRYVVMPDHVHFFAAPEPGCVALERFVGAWKEWTAKHLKRDCLVKVPIWQARFFDHVLRSSESYAEKWEYVRLNPVRAGLVANPEDWPFSGFIDFDSPM
jgi:putative transposase